MGQVSAPVQLSSLTTLGLGGPAPQLIDGIDDDTIREVVTAADRDGSPLLLIAGGSNLVIADAGVDHPVLRIATHGVSAERDGDDLLIDVAAGEPWDEVVHAFVADGWSGLASLSGIPGRTGATPIQNVGAYGTEISAVLVDVTLHDRATGELRRVPATDLHLGYRTSMLRGTDAAVVLRVRLRLTRIPPPVRYAELARMLNVHSGDGAPPAEVRAAVLELRRGKGMVLDPADPDTRSVGSFFTNPILDYDQAEIVDRQIRARFGTDAHYPRYPAENGAKLSAAWLIERAGFPRGFALPGAPGAAISSKHTLALTNRGGSTADLLALARHIREGVVDAFGIELNAEPILVGVQL